MESIGKSSGLYFVLSSTVFCTMVCLCFNGCTKNNVTGSNGGGGSYTIYTSGFYMNPNSGRTPCYWKGTTRTDLPGGIGFTSSIFVSGGVVYTAGYHYNSTGGQAPCYWQGTTMVDLSYDSTGSGYTLSICVSNGTVYTAGHYSNKPCYWINSVRQELQDTVLDPFISSIYVEDTTVYLGGYYFPNPLNPDQSTPCYWQGNVRTDLTTGGTGTGEVNSIYVSDGVVYAAGGYNGGTPCYWAGSVKTDLPGAGGSASSIWVEGGTVYTSGSLSGNPCYWAGTSRTNLNGSDVYSICVKGGTVFTAGDYYKQNPDDPNDGFSCPCYWVGNNRNDLPLPMDYSGNEATAIFVE